MRTASFTELRHNAKTYFDQVENGETIQISRHGKVIAKIVPVTENEKLPSWKRPGLKLAIKGVSLCDAIINERKKGK